MPLFQNETKYGSKKGARTKCILLFFGRYRVDAAGVEKGKGMEHALPSGLRPMLGIDVSKNLGEGGACVFPYVIT